MDPHLAARSTSQANAARDSGVSGLDWGATTSSPSWWSPWACSWPLSHSGSHSQRFNSHCLACWGTAAAPITTLVGSALLVGKLEGSEGTARPPHGKWLRVM